MSRRNSNDDGVLSDGHAEPEQTMVQGNPLNPTDDELEVSSVSSQRREDSQDVNNTSHIHFSPPSSHDASSARSVEGQEPQAAASLVKDTNVNNKGALLDHYIQHNIAYTGTVTKKQMEELLRVSLQYLSHNDQVLTLLSSGILNESQKALLVGTVFRELGTMFTPATSTERKVEDGDTYTSPYLIRLIEVALTHIDPAKSYNVHGTKEESLYGLLIRLYQVAHDEKTTPHTLFRCDTVVTALARCESSDAFVYSMENILSWVFGYFVMYLPYLLNFALVILALVFQFSLLSEDQDNNPFAKGGVYQSKIFRHCNGDADCIQPAFQSSCFLPSSDYLDLLEWIEIVNHTKPCEVGVWDGTAPIAPSMPITKINTTATPSSSSKLEKCIGTNSLDDCLLGEGKNDAVFVTYATSKSLVVLMAYIQKAATPQCVEVDASNYYDFSTHQQAIVGLCWTAVLASWVRLIATSSTTMMNKIDSLTATMSNMLLFSATVLQLLVACMIFSESQEVGNSEAKIVLAVLFGIWLLVCVWVVYRVRVAASREEKIVHVASGAIAVVFFILSLVCDWSYPTTTMVLVGAGSVVLLHVLLIRQLSSKYTDWTIFGGAVLGVGVVIAVFYAIAFLFIDFDRYAARKIKIPLQMKEDGKIPTEHIQEYIRVSRMRFAALQQLIFLSATIASGSVLVIPMSLFRRRFSPLIIFFFFTPLLQWEISTDPFSTFIDVSNSVIEAFCGNDPTFRFKFFIGGKLYFMTMGVLIFRIILMASRDNIGLLCREALTIQRFFFVQVKNLFRPPESTPDPITRDLRDYKGGQSWKNVLSPASTRILDDLKRAHDTTSSTLDTILTTLDNIKHEK